MKKKIFTLSNLLSVSRIILLPFILCFILRSNNINSKISALILMSIAIITDFLDGYFARRFNQETELGKILDPISDKILIVCIGFVFFQKEIIPLWFFLIVFLRDFLILFLSFFLLKKKVVLKSNFLGKITVTILSFVLLIAYLQIDFLKNYMFYFYLFSTFFLLLSSYSYTKRFFNS